MTVFRPRVRGVDSALPIVVPRFATLDRTLLVPTAAPSVSTNAGFLFKRLLKKAL
jgi:hypothetical protein